MKDGLQRKDKRKKDGRVMAGMNGLDQGEERRRSFPDDNTRIHVRKRKA